MRLKLGKKRILVIPDTQAPFEHKDAYRFLAAVKRKYKPNEIVHIGDEVDMHAMGDWDKDPDGMSAGEELEAAIKSMHKLYKLFPKVKVCTSNHTARPFRRAFKFGFAKAFLKGYNEMLEAPRGWEWRERWEIDNIVFEHGEGESGQIGHIRACNKNMQSTVIGHIHAFAGINYTANRQDLLFGMNVGCLIDIHAYAFAYGKKFKQKPILGCGFIDKGIPRLIPMLLNGKGRWVGKL